MHDIKFIRDNPKKFDENMKNRKVDISSENILKIDKRNRELISNLQIFQEERNILSKQIGILIPFFLKCFFNINNEFSSCT